MEHKLRAPQTTEEHRLRPHRLEDSLASVQAGWSNTNWRKRWVRNSELEQRKEAASQSQSRRLRHIYLDSWDRLLQLDPRIGTGSDGYICPLSDPKRCLRSEQARAAHL